MSGNTFLKCCYILMTISVLTGIILITWLVTKDTNVFRRKLQRYCSETGEIFNSLSDAVRKCDATKNCDKIMNENCDSQGSFSICTENAIEYPSGPLGSCIYTRNYTSDDHCDNEFILKHQNIAGVCKLSDLNGCDENQICVQNGKQSDLGNCYCLSGYKLQENNQCQPEPCPDKTPLMITKKEILVSVLMAFVFAVIVIGFVTYYYINRNDTKNRRTANENHRNFSFQQVSRNEKKNVFCVERF